ncbi:hypothetical protein MXB_3970 [Myxobolus squamalis]|nr:hypothetical protein MXB_3970 [Myxobolus squamalis]
MYSRDMCKNFKIVDKNFFEPRSSCGKIENHCVVNNNYQNKIKYFPKKASIGLEYLIENLVMVLKMTDNYNAVMVVCMSLWKFVPNTNVIIIDPTKRNLDKEFVHFLRKYKDYLKYVSPLGEFNVGEDDSSSDYDNKLLSLKKKYVLMMEENYMIGERSDLTKLVEVLESTDASIAGGKYSGDNLSQCDSFGIFYTSIDNNKSVLIQSNGKVHEAITG